MDVRVRFFASLRGLTGETEISLEIPEGTTLGSLFARLVEIHPDLADQRPRILLAVDGKVCQDSQSLSAGDDIALLPPVSGG